MEVPAAVEVLPHDLAAIIDPEGVCAVGSPRDVDGGEAAAGVEEAKALLRSAALEISHDLATIVDSTGEGVIGNPGDIDGGEAAARIHKAMVVSGAVEVCPHNLAAIVDPVWPENPTLASRAYKG
jgi:hypothetical protein